MSARERALVFSRTTGYRHESIEHAAGRIRELLDSLGLDAEHTESVADHAHLDEFALVVWLSTSGRVLGDDERARFAEWLERGGAWAGVHAATTSEPDWPPFARIAGARFTDHPDVQSATVRVADAAHPSTADLPAEWVHTDEWYNFDRMPAGRTVLLTVDESTYDGGTMGAAHPISWHGPVGDGATWYTALGHAADAYDDPLIRSHLAGGLASLADAVRARRAQ